MSSQTSLSSPQFQNSSLRARMYSRTCPSGRRCGRRYSNSGLVEGSMLLMAWTMRSSVSWARRSCWRAAAVCFTSWRVSRCCQELQGTEWYSFTASLKHSLSPARRCSSTAKSTRLNSACSCCPCALFPSSTIRARSCFPSSRHQLARPPALRIGSSRNCRVSHRQRIAHSESHTVQPSVTSSNLSLASRMQQLRTASLESSLRLASSHCAQTVRVSSQLGLPTSSPSHAPASNSSSSGTPPRMLAGGKSPQTLFSRHARSRRPRQSSQKRSLRKSARCLQGAGSCVSRPTEAARCSRTERALAEPSGSLEAGRARLKMRARASKVARGSGSAKRCAAVSFGMGCLCLRQSSVVLSASITPILYIGSIAPPHRPSLLFPSWSLPCAFVDGLF